MTGQTVVNEEKVKARARMFEGEKWLVGTALLGFLLAAVCGIRVLLAGELVAPDGNLANAFSFNAALGIFLLSTAAISPYSGLGRRGRSVFRWSYIVIALYAYGAETIQNFRGVNPRFAQSGAVDIWIGAGFGFAALLLVLFYVFFAVSFFRRQTSINRPELTLGIRYSMIAVMLSFAAGIWISVMQSRFTGSHGNIIWLHGLGFHALQAIPLVAWLTEHTNGSPAARKRLIHLTGISFLAGLAGVAWQTFLGQSVWEWSSLPVISLLCFLLSLALGVVALIGVRKRYYTAGDQAA